jgi:hypothetical protein
MDIGPKAGYAMTDNGGMLVRRAHLCERPSLRYLRFFAILSLTKLRFHISTSSRDGPRSILTLVVSRSVRSLRISSSHADPYVRFLSQPRTQSSPTAP